MGELLTKHDDDSLYTYTRQRLETVCTEPQLDVEPYQVAARGLYWQVVGGTLDAPGRSYHGYEVVYRRVSTETGVWHEAEVRNPCGRAVRHLGYAETQGYIVQDGSLSEAMDEQASAAAVLIDQTQFSPDISAAAALEMISAQ